MSTDRIPPQNIFAEQSVLGAMLLSTEAADKAIAILAAEDFYRYDHQLIFNAIAALRSRDEAADLVTVAEELRRQGKFEAVGGSKTLTSLSDVATTANIEYHAKIVAEKALRRRLINTSAELEKSGYDDEKNTEQIIDEAEQKIMSLNRQNRRKTITPTKELVKNFMGKVEELYDVRYFDVTGLSTGFSDLDRMTHGLQPSDLIILAARPSMGKTALALNIAENAAITNSNTVAFVTLEMSKEQLVARLMSSISGISSTVLATGRLEEEDWPKVVEAGDKLSSAGVDIDGGDYGGLIICDSGDDIRLKTVAGLKSTMREIKRKCKKLDLIIVDYVQLMISSSKESNRNLELTAISSGLKDLAKELKVPVIALSQLSRAVENRQDKHPMLSDLRESGALEQDADIVMFLYREDYYNPNTDNKNIAELNIAKHRNGETGTIKLFFRKSLTKFLDLKRHDPSAAANA